MSSGAFDQGQKYRDEPVIVLAKPGSPMLAPSLEPKRLRREELLAAAQEARRQLCRGPRVKGRHGAGRPLDVVLAGQRLGF